MVTQGLGGEFLQHGIGGNPRDTNIGWGHQDRCVNHLPPPGQPHLLLSGVRPSGEALWVLEKLGPSLPLGSSAVEGQTSQYMICNNLNNSNNPF